MNTALSKDRLLDLFMAYEQSVQNYKSQKKRSISASKRREIFEITQEQLFYKVPQVVLHRVDENIEVADNFNVDEDHKDGLLHLIQNFKRLLELTEERVPFSQFSALFDRYCYKNEILSVKDDLLETTDDHKDASLEEKATAVAELNEEENIKPVTDINENVFASEKNNDDNIIIGQRRRTQNTTTATTDSGMPEKAVKSKATIKKFPIKRTVPITKPKLRTRHNIVKIEKVLGKSSLSEVKIIIPSALQNELTKNKLKMSLDLNNAYLTTNENLQDCNGSCKCCKMNKNKNKKSKLASYIETFSHNVGLEETSYANMELSHNVISTTTADIHTPEGTENNSETAAAISTVLSTNERGEWILTAPNTVTDGSSQVITFSHERVNSEMQSSLCLPNSCNVATLDDDFMIPIDIESSAYDLVNFIEGRGSNEVPNTITNAESSKNINIISCEVFPTETYVEKNYNIDSSPLVCESKIVNRRKNSSEMGVNLNKESSVSNRSDKKEDDESRATEQKRDNICESDVNKKQDEKTSSSILPDMPDLMDLSFEMESATHPENTKTNDILSYYTTNDAAEKTESSPKKLNSELPAQPSPASNSNDFDDDALSIYAASLEGFFSPSNADERFDIAPTPIEEIYEDSESKNDLCINTRKRNQTITFESDIKKDTQDIGSNLSKGNITKVTLNCGQNSKLGKKQDLLQDCSSPKPFKIPKLNSKMIENDMSLNGPSCNNTTVLGQVDKCSSIVSFNATVNGEHSKKSNKFNPSAHGNSEDGVHEAMIRRQVIQNVYNNPCFKFLRDRCAEKKCRYRHGLLSSRIIKKRLLDMSLTSKVVALKFILRHAKLFHLYFTTFCEIFTETKNQKQLLEMVDYCILFMNSEIYLKEIFKGLNQIGFTAVDALKLILQRLQQIDYSSGCISVIIDLIIQSNINEFLPLLHNLLDMENCRKVDEIIKLANVCIETNHTELSQLVLKVILFQIPYETMKEDRCKSIITFLNMVRNSNSTECVDNYLTNLDFSNFNSLCQSTN